MDKYSIIEKIMFLSTFLNKKKLERMIEGKTILISGASSGIGAQVAYRLCDYNVHLILVARREEILLSMKNEIEKKNAKVSIYAIDLRDEEKMDGFLQFIHHLPNGLDIVVSNAGKSIRRSIYKSLDRYHDFTRTMAINYLAPVKLLLSVIPLLEVNQGQIINVSTSEILFLPMPYWAAYHASKSAFDAWFRSVGPELNAQGITTTTFYLPLVKTPMIKPNEKYKNMPAMKPVHVAKLICKSMYTKRKRYRPWWMVVGQLISLLFRRPIEFIMTKSLKKRGKV